METDGEVDELTNKVEPLNIEEYNENLNNLNASVDDCTLIGICAHILHRIRKRYLMCIFFVVSMLIWTFIIVEFL